MHTNSAYSNTKEARKKEIIAVVYQKLSACSQFVHICVLELCHFCLKGKGKMRRYISLLLALVMAFALAACTNSPAENTDSPASPETETTAPSENNDAPSVDANDGADENALPDYTYLSEGIGENGCFAGVKASDIVTLPEYKGISAPTSVVTADPDAVAQEVESLLNSLSERVEVTDRAVEDGDTINIDYVGSVDGVEFTGGNTQGQGAEVTIGVTNYIDDFLQQLIGHMPGENFDIEVTFPEDYGRDDLNGKDAIFNVTINYIVGTVTESEITDAVAAKLGYESADELSAAIEEYVVRNAKNEFISSIYEQSEIAEIPESVQKNVEDYVRFNVEQNYGVDLAAFCQYIGTTEEEYLAHAVESVGKNYLSAQAIAEIENIEVTDEDVIAGGYENAVEVFGVGYVKRYILMQTKVPEFIIANAVIG